MINKNVADYTNFDGKTNKKIVQAPGGASSFSIGWNNEKTDYGPERVHKKKGNYPQHEEEPASRNAQDYQKQGGFNYKEPIRVMEEKPQNYLRQEAYSMQQPAKNYGGQYGYNNIQQDYQKPKQQEHYQHDSLDLKMKEHGETKNSFSRPPQPPNRTCVKIHEQKSNLVLGDNNYNYWKEPEDNRRNSNQSNRRNAYEQPRSADKRPNQPSYPQQQSYQQQQNYQQPVQQAHTSVKVHNPPGGKSSFTLG